MYVTFTCTDVQRGVASRCGGVGRGAVVQQQLHQLFVAHPGGAVEGSLVVLETGGGDRSGDVRLVQPPRKGRCYLGLGVHLSRVLEQELSNLAVSSSGSHVERSLHLLRTSETQRQPSTVNTGQQASRRTNLRAGGGRKREKRRRRRRRVFALTTLEALGEAPLWRRVFTMFR